MTIRTVLPFLAGALALGGCVNDVVVLAGGGPPEGGGGPPEGGAPPAIQATSPDLDLLLVVDNSINMAVKQEQLAAQIQTLIGGLVDPPCVTASGDIEPPLEGGACGPNAARQFAPVQSLHVGVISSSLGDLTAGACSSVANPDDKGRLLTRGLNGSVDTPSDQGFLTYEQGVDATPDDLIAKTQELILGAGQVGCGYEMPLEAMARFLVDPAPYEALVTGSGGLTKSGTDQVVLAQRAAFLRPTSSLAVLLISDEDDCSIDIGGAGYLTLRTQPFYKSTSECASNPSDACCTSCALLDDNPGCDTGGNCTEGSNTTYAAADDHANLRCFEQKRRYGVDFKYPAQRYVNALSAVTIDPADPSYGGPGASTPNPLFAGGRDPSQISFLTMGGVPWQDVVVDPLDVESRYRTADELSASGAWNWITGLEPADPFMDQSVEQRSGTNPANGEQVSISNGINGGDRTITDKDGLQYSCLFLLPEPVEFTTACSDCLEGCDDPSCDGTFQVYGTAYPQSRALEVARGLGSRGRVASVCRPVGDDAAMNALLVRAAVTLE